VEVHLTEYLEDFYNRLDLGQECYLVSAAKDYEVIDRQTGIHYHLYDEDTNKPYELVYKDKVVLHGKIMRNEEVAILTKIKKLIPMLQRKEFSKLIKTFKNASDKPKDKPVVKGSVNGTY
jgi:hypothetical protein